MAAKEFTMFILIRILLSVLIACALLIGAIPVFAQGSQPPPTTGAWSEVVGPDGTINYSNLTDGGVVTQQANWMPNIPLVGPINASYHVYYTPSGNSVVLPTATTLFFMAANASESGFSAAASTMGTSGASTVNSNDGNTVGIAALGALFGAMLGNQDIGLPSSTNATDFFGQVFSGQTNLWSLNPGGLFQFLTTISQNDLNDHSIYTYMLLYTPGQCATAPGGCSPDQLALLATPVPTLAPPPTKCPRSSVKPGAISAGGQESWPPYPLVVGQDPAKNGVNLSLHASVAPTIYTYYTQEAVKECTPGAVNGVYNCWAGGVGGHKEVTGFQCVQHTESYSECIASASGSVSLSQASREWILNELSIHFPEAYIHQPYFGVGGSGCVWSASGNKVQINDPGIWNISVSGRTSGTPVSGPRSFTRSGSDFKVWLKEIAIVK